MTTTVNLRKLLHRKAWESCTTSPVATTAGGFIVCDKYGLLDDVGAILMTAATTAYLYVGKEDSWVQLPASGATGTFAAGSCGELRGMGAMGGVFTQTATGGSTTTIVTNRTIVKSLKGCGIRVIAGAGVGYNSTITSNTLGANAVITVPVNGVAFDATTQYQIYSGSLWFFNAGTVAVGFTVYDIATNAWTARSVTGLPTAFGTDGHLISTMGSVKTFATGTTTSATGTTLVNSGKAWGTNMWANYQVRITAGTGIGQIRPISSNTGTTLTVSSAWTVNPDATSVYVIEGNDDFFYLLGNNAVTLYRYTVSTNTWATLSPVAARAGAAGAGTTADWIDNTTGWDNETLVSHNQAANVYKQNGRYIYSFRGAGSAILDIYDIAANTWISAQAYGNSTETFNAGTSAVDADGFIYINKEATGRIFRFDIDGNKLEPFAVNTNQVALGGSAVVGDKMFILPYVDGGTKINFLYVMRHSAADLMRMLII